MSQNPYPMGDSDYQARLMSVPVSQSRSDIRAAFIRKTYMHLAGAIGAFIVLETILLQLGFGKLMLNFLGNAPFGWIMILGAFMLVGWVATHMAHNVESEQTQYLGLGLYVLAEAIIFAPMLEIAVFHCPGPVLPTAALLTFLLFIALTCIVFTTKKDFSFLRGALMVGFILAFGTIIAAAFMGFSLGLFFSFVMVGLAAGAILYDTSNVLHHYRPGQHVAASLQLFASVALLFWYILRIVIALSQE